MKAVKKGLKAQLQDYKALSQDLGKKLFEVLDRNQALNHKYGLVYDELKRLKKQRRAK